MELATWEDEDEVRHLLPDATARGRAVSSGGEDVTKTVSSNQNTGRAGKEGSRPKRVLRPSVLVNGPLWVKG